ncbi:type II toxin-antitoxin system RelE/ParE family toxin [Candidatus Daviesbacteria bacterium]|nr:type II toxin-antitoxin system RelE/ParE family toxin [Candidatus Daviesbacteria bacterium]
MVKLLKPAFTEKFKKQFKKLPKSLQKRFNDKLKILLSNTSYPGLHSRKMSSTGYFEARLTEHYRFTYEIVENAILFLTIGPHDEGLGKK